MADEIIGQKLRYMSQSKFETITEKDDEFYAVSGSGIGFPSNKFDELTLGASGTEYVAPANGWFFIDKNSGSSNQYISIFNDTKGYKLILSAYNSGTAMGDLFPAQKNDIIRIVYSASGTTNTFRFIYAEGE